MKKVDFCLMIPKKEQGFTLLELMVVIVSIIILASLILLFR